MADASWAHRTVDGNNCVQHNRSLVSGLSCVFCVVGFHCFAGWRGYAPTDTSEQVGIAEGGESSRSPSGAGHIANLSRRNDAQALGARIDDIQIGGGANGNSERRVQLSRQGRAAVPSGTASAIAGNGGDGPILCHLSNSEPAGLGNVEVARRVQCHTERALQLGGGCGPVISTGPSFAISGNRGDLTVCGDPSNA